MNKKAQGWWFLIILAVLVVGWLIVNNVYIPYETQKVFDPTLHCENGVVKKESGILGTFAGFFSGFSCLEYAGAKYTLTCNENNEIIATCKATIWDRFFSTKKEGEWLLGK
ncbi:MAG TPA: hypothetical protein VJH65_00370 [Candidatus Nanoarchaeia archaeon]|nr:hypothetical protein [Candidatus Nanoarchaeia archaeon]